MAANNISAAQIRDDYLRRQAEAQASSSTAQANGQNDDEEDEEAAQAAADAAIERSRKRKRAQDDAISKIKGKKGKDKKHKKSKKGDGSDDDSDFEAFIGKEMYKKALPKPGQLENCELCGKRFTVTPYSKAGPDDGLLCTPCGKELAKDAKQEAKPKKSSNAGRKRRKIESDRLDGKIQLGAKSLQQLCIEKVAQFHDDVEDLTELPPQLIDRLSQIFTKNRVLKPKALPLFLRSDLRSVIIHDCAYLDTENFSQIFGTVPDVDKIHLSNACQFKDENVDYMIEKAPGLKHITLYAANLVSNEKWSKLISAYGYKLETLKLQWLDAAFEDEHVWQIAKECSSLQRLKLERCRRIGEDALAAISTMSTLKHLSLQLSHQVPTEAVLNMINRLGSGLETLSLDGFRDMDDTIIDALKANCSKLSKLRICDNDIITDAAYASLFTESQNPPLRFIDMSVTRDVDNNEADGPKEPVGLAAAGFEAMMQHSARALEYLNIASCRHIPNEALQNVFSGELNKFPQLKEIDLSFVGGVDTVVMAGIFRSCPKIVKVVAFGCFGIEDIVVPRGVVVIGVPRAQDAIEQFGQGETTDAIGAMAGLLNQDLDMTGNNWTNSYIAAAA